MSTNEPTQFIPLGLCQCGCGNRTNVNSRTNTLKGHVKGQPQRYLLGHNPTGYRSVENYFWSFITPASADTCWEWQSETQMVNGYGSFQFQGKRYYAHRISWELHNGQPIPDGYHVCHKCDNPRCANPHHLFIGTNLENIKDKIRKNRQTKGTDQHYAKLNAEMVTEMRKMSTQGNTYRSIANHFGVVISVAWEAINRVTWKHVP